MAKTISEQVNDLEATRAAKAAAMEELATKSVEAGETMDAADAEAFDELDAEIKQIDEDLKRFKRLESLCGQAAKPVTGEQKTDPTKTTPVTRSHDGHIIIAPKDVEEKFKGQNFTRMVIAKAMAHIKSTEIGAPVSPVSIAQKRWGQTNPTLVNIIKTAVEGGGELTGEWGAELVAADNRYTGDFIEYLDSQTVFNQIPFREVPANVNIKGQDGAATGYWVGEGKAIPVSKADFSDIDLTNLKAAALAVISNELIRDSSPSAEALVRDALVEASSQKVDTTAFSTTAASAGVSPAGLLNGLTAILSTGDDVENVRGDIKNLYSPFLTAKHASGLVLVMNPALAKSTQLMVNALGQVAFPNISASGGTLLGDQVYTGDNINANHVILLDPKNVWRIGDMGVSVSISKEAMIEMNDAPTGDELTPTSASVHMVSMFQSESTAIKVVRPINFQKRRTTAVAYISDADWGAVSSS